MAQCPALRFGTWLLAPWNGPLVWPLPLCPIDRPSGPCPSRKWLDTQSCGASGRWFCLLASAATPRPIVQPSAPSPIVLPSGSALGPLPHGPAVTKLCVQTVGHKSKCHEIMRSLFGPEGSKTIVMALCFLVDGPQHICREIMCVLGFMNRRVQKTCHESLCSCV